jgi:hypothetical protein
MSFTNINSMTTSSLEKYDDTSVNSKKGIFYQLGKCINFKYFNNSHQFERINDETELTELPNNTKKISATISSPNFNKKMSATFVTPTAIVVNGNQFITAVEVCAVVNDNIINDEPTFKHTYPTIIYQTILEKTSFTKEQIDKYFHVALLFKIDIIVNKIQLFMTLSDRKFEYISNKVCSLLPNKYFKSGFCFISKTTQLKEEQHCWKNDNLFAKQLKLKGLKNSDIYKYTNIAILFYIKSIVREIKILKNFNKEQYTLYCRAVFNDDLYNEIVM